MNLRILACSVGWTGQAGIQGGEDDVSVILPWPRISLAISGVGLELPEGAGLELWSCPDPDIGVVQGEDGTGSLS